MSSFLGALRTAPRTLSRSAAFSTTAARSVARMTLVGRLVDTPTVESINRNSESNGPSELVKYVVAVNHGPTRPASFFRVVNFNALGSDYLLTLKKGTMVYVEGDATYRKLVSEEGKEQWALGVVQRGPISVLARPRSEFAESAEPDAAESEAA